MAYQRNKQNNTSNKMNTIKTITATLCFLSAPYKVECYDGTTALKLLGAVAAIGTIAILITIICHLYSSPFPENKYPTHNYHPSVPPSTRSNLENTTTYNDGSPPPSYSEIPPSYRITESNSNTKNNNKLPTSD